MLVLISIVSVIGTIVPQLLDPADYLKIFPEAGRFILKAGLDNVYQSELFSTLLFLLAVCTLFCTLTRFSYTRRKILSRSETADPSEIRAMQVSEEVNSEKSIVLVAAKLVSWKSRETETGDKVFSCITGRTSLIGAFFIHVGLLLILCGGLAGRNMAVETFISAREGDVKLVPSVDALRAASKADSLRRKGRKLQVENTNDPYLSVLAAEINILEKKYQIDVEKPAFKLKFEKLSLEESSFAKGNSMSAQEQWCTHVSVLENDKVVATSVIMVNAPFHYSGYSFFQSDWKKVYSKVKLRAVLRNNSGVKGKLEPRDFEVVPGQPIKPAWSPYTFVLIDFFPDFRIINQKFTSVSQELNNPAGRIVAYDSGEKLAGRAWAFSNDMNELGEHVSDLPWNFLVMGAEPAFETGLQLTSDPSVPLVWLGGIIMALGMILAFYVSYIEKWVVIKADGRVIAAVSGNRPQRILREYLTEVLKQIE
ncbi:MAG: cytochrome c biogenesis protein ResB [Candidatus Riflebacteria bacterium]|nr:cytochrome c biogenesis protein ResB [Candidatus Riflebacteria bacterium]